MDNRFSSFYLGLFKKFGEDMQLPYIATKLPVPFFRSIQKFLGDHFQLAVAFLSPHQRLNMVPYSNRQGKRETAQYH
jgi:hypothetical protein